MVSKEELEGLTVPQLKERLKDAGLTVGGKKAELVERLLSSDAVNVPEPISLGTVTKKSSGDSSGELPLFKAIIADGLGSSDLDYRIVSQRVAGLVLLIVAIIGLGSMSWYTAEMDMSDLEGEGVMIGEDFDLVYNMGLTEISQVVTSGFGGAGMEVTISMSECVELDEESESEGDAGPVCSEMAAASTTMGVVLWISIIVLSLWLLLLFLNGWGILDGTPLEEKLEMIDKWSVVAISSLLGLGILFYGLMGGPIVADEEPWSGGLGGMWWMSFLTWLIFVGVSYGSDLKSFIDSKRAA
ncbi:MAG: hypothetical protein CMB49_05615 [Euryarchaeota archaeon]|nr:hypothetical protein [Euryarchaeota archaeon]